MREHVAAVPADGQHLIEAAALQRLARYEEDHVDPDETAAQRLFRYEAEYRAKGELDEYLLKAARESSDPLSHALVLGGSLPDDESADQARALLVEIAAKLCALPPDGDEVLLAQCRVVGHRALRLLDLNHCFY